MSTGAIDSMPSAIAAIACTPPSTWISSAPASAIAATTAGAGLPSNGGVQAITRLQPATFAVSTLMCAEASNGYLPPGT
ncbi:hypothetical protein bAD24_p01800 (plasmid) [Burkholderia sp. AD24]|nr:hypothetical protein bAD24_p01800 [Burkholderia sp. AD24]